jgi:hypothetical protein
MIAGNREEKKVTLYVFLWFAGFRWMGWFRSVSGEERKPVAGMEVFGTENAKQTWIIKTDRKIVRNFKIH